MNRFKAFTEQELEIIGEQFNTPTFTEAVSTGHEPETSLFHEWAGAISTVRSKRQLAERLQARHKAEKPLYDRLA